MTRPETEIREAVARAACARAERDGLPGDAEVSRQFASALLDVVPDARLPVRVLAQALGEGVATELQRAVSDHEVAMARLAQRLENSHGIRPDLAHWAVATISHMVRGEAPLPSPATAGPVNTLPSAPPPATAPMAAWSAEGAARQLATDAPRTVPFPGSYPAAATGQSGPGFLMCMTMALAFGLVGGLLHAVTRPALLKVDYLALDYYGVFLAGFDIVSVVAVSLLLRSPAVTIVTGLIIVTVSLIVDNVVNISIVDLTSAGASLASSIAAAVYLLLRRDPQKWWLSGIEIALVVSITWLLFFIFGADGHFWLYQSMEAFSEPFPVFVGGRLASALVFTLAVAALAEWARRRWIVRSASRLEGPAIRESAR